MLAGCDIGYLARGAYEEGRLLWHRKPISEVLARADLAAETRAKLETVLAVRKFAADRLGLNVGGAYRTVPRWTQGAIVWMVMAAPRDLAHALHLVVSDCRRGAVSRLLQSRHAPRPRPPTGSARLRYSRPPGRRIFQPRLLQ